MSAACDEGRTDQGRGRDGGLGGGRSCWCLRSRSDPTGCEEMAVYFFFKSSREYV